MKKYNYLFFCSVIASIVLTITYMTVVSYFATVPAYLDGNLSNAFSGGKRDFLTILLLIILPIFIMATAIIAIQSYKTSHKGKELDCKSNKNILSISPILFFIICSSVVTVFSIIFVIVHRNTIWDHHVFLFGENRFMDFFNHITYAQFPKTTYEQSEHACFPPLAYLMYLLFSRLLPMDRILEYHEANPSKFAMTSAYATLLYIIYTIILCVLVFQLVKKYLYRFGSGTSTIVFILILLSNFFISTVERGNSVLIVLALLLGALLLKDSKSPVRREVALILIAIATGFKIYPAIFGVLYILERRYKEALRLMVYGALFFFVPFAFFGGVDGFKHFMLNQLTIHGELYSSLQSISSSICLISEKITGNITTFSVVAKIAPIVFGLACIVAASCKRIESWERLFLICSIIVFCPSWSGNYTLIYFVIPMLVFFKDSFSANCAKPAKHYYVVAFGFSLVFSMISFVTASGKLVSNISYIALYLICLIIIGKTLFYRIKPKNSI